MCFYQFYKLLIFHCGMKNIEHGSVYLVRWCVSLCCVSRCVYIMRFLWFLLYDYFVKFPWLFDDFFIDEISFIAIISLRYCVFYDCTL